MNRLTQQLLKKGYTSENHPNSVRWNNTDGFTYTLSFLSTTVWECPCGLLEQGEYFSGSSTSFMGMDYLPENNNPLGRCPHAAQTQCCHKVEGMVGQEVCIYRFSKRSYSDAQSTEKACAEADKPLQSAYNAIVRKYGPCDCLEINYTTGTVEARYDVKRCIARGCKNEVCAITHKPRDLHMVNIFVDKLFETTAQDGFLKETIRTHRKGIKQFKKAVARTDAEKWLSLNPYKMQDEWTEKKEGTSLVQHRSTITKVQICARYQKDLDADGRDTEKGITVVYQREQEAAWKASKTMQRERSAQQRQASKQRQVEQGRYTQVSIY